MRIRKHSRITALALALVMILPLISIPAFAEGEEPVVLPVTYTEDFSNAESVSDVLASYGALATIVDGALRIEYAAHDDGKYYVMTDQNHAYEIAGAEFDGTTLTAGTVTISGVTYTVAGELNTEDVKIPTVKATLTDGESNAYTGNAYIVTGATVDAWKGAFNVGKANEVKLGAISKDSYTKVTTSVDYFISEDVNDKAAFELTWYATSGRVDMAKLNVTTDYVELSHHGDAGSPKAASTALRTPKGTWFNVKTIMDITTGDIELYLNGTYGLTITDAHLQNGLAENKWNLLQISRGSTQAPTAMEGYILVDNLSVSTDVTVYSSSDFDAYEGITAFRNGTYMNNFAYPGGIPSKLEAVTEDGNTYLKYNFGSDLLDSGYSYYHATSGAVDDDGDGIVDFFAYAGYTKWEKNAEIASYDQDSKILTLYDGTEYTVTAQSAANIAKGFYGNFTYNGTSYKLTTPAYAAALQFGDGNIDKNIAIRVAPYSYEDYDEIYLSAKYFIAPGSKGTAQSQFYRITKNGTANDWNDLYNIDLATGALTIGGSLPIGQWAELGMKINLDSGDITFYVDGLQVAKKTAPFGVNLALRSSATNYGGTGWILAKQLKTEGALSDDAGSISIDDVKMTALSEMPAVVYAKTDFESDTVGAQPTSVNVAVSQSTVTNDHGSNAWKIDFEATASADVLNRDKNSTVKNPALSYTDATSLVFEADYFIEANSYGRLQSQLKSISNNGTAQNWNDLYVIDFTGDNAGNVYLQREGGSADGFAVLQAGRWFTVSAVLNMVNGKLDIYLDGKLAFESALNMKDHNAVSNISFTANQWVVGKVNKFASKGTFYLDNLSIYAADAPKEAAAPEKTVRDFEEFEYSVGKSPRKSGMSAVPTLMTYTKQADGNMALRLDMGAASTMDKWALWKSDSTKCTWDVTREYIEEDDCYIINGEYIEEKENEDDPYGFVLIPNDQGADERWYVLPEAYAEAAYNRTNVGAATKFAHDEFSYKTSKYAVLEADYFIEEGSTGIAESQFEGFYYDVEEEVEGVPTVTATKGGWLQLFHIHMETGRITGQGGTNGSYYAKIGEWNNFKLLVDLEEGTFELYVNGVWARSYDCGQKNITLGSSNYDWSIAKVQRHNTAFAGPYEGALLIDNVSIRAEGLTTSESYGNKFLTNAAYEEFVADVITVKDGASIRLTDPSGLRFASKIDTLKLAHLEIIFGAEARMGTLITPADYLASTENVTRATLEAIEKTNKYLDVEFDGTYFSGAVDFNLEEGEKYMVGSIVNIKAANIDRAFAGLGYIELVVDGQVIGGLYSDVVVRSVQEVAQAALDSGVEYTDAQNAILSAYAVGNQPS